jgi:CP family cyanate transporter-like MFS transporter
VDGATETSTDAVPAARRREALLLVGAIVLVSLNLRSAITTVGPLIGDIRADLGLSGTAVGLLAAAPLVAFGLVSPLGPRLAARYGIERTLLACMLVLAAALAVRPLPPVALLFLGTLAAGAGIAIANVLLPALVKRRFGERATFMTGIYSVALGTGAALGAGLAVPSEQWLGGSWRGALALWTAPALLAALVWLPQLRRAPTRASAAPRGRVNLWHDPIARNVTGFMAIQSVLFYSMVAWLPEIYRHHGLSKGSAGALLSLALTVGIPLGLVVATVAGRLADQRPIAAVAVALTTAGWLGVLLAPTAAPSAWASLLGLGFGCGFTLVLALMVLRAADVSHAAELSGMAQSVGYTLAAVGPVAIGALHDLTGNWTVPLAVLVAGALLELVVALPASRPGFVRGRGAPAPSAAEPAPAVVR